VATVSRSGEPGSVRSTVRQALRFLHDLLWPADWAERPPTAPDRPVTVVPYGLLGRVPFAALLDRAGQPLAARHALTVLPGLSLLEGLLDRRAARPAGPQNLLAFVDPEPAPAGLEPLSWTRTAFPELARLYGPGRSTVHTGAAATAERLAREAPYASVLCLATHAEAYGTHAGRATEPDPMDSYVALAATLGGHDGRLRARDLPDLELGADLVVLSACESGSGRVTADGVISLGRAFLVRGPTAVLLTLARVREDDSLDLVFRFHRHWLQEGWSRAAALRRAQLSVARDYPDAPERWAFFALLGVDDDAPNVCRPISPRTEGPHDDH
jgi:CHAT domain-containing protein